jgi:membrane associated rhomboid family serine protease
MKDNTHDDDKLSLENTEDELAFERAYEKRLGETSVLSVASKSAAQKALFQAFLGITICYVFSAVYWRSEAHSYGFSGLSSERSQIFEHYDYWRLVTSLAVHSDLSHFFSNAVLFGVFSYVLRAYIGFIAYPLLALISGVLTQILTLWTYPDGTVLIGASGMIYAMAGMWLSYYLRFENLHSKWTRLMRVMAFILVVLMPSIIRPQVSYRAHAIGFAVGCLMAMGSFLIVEKRLSKRRGISE